MNAPAHDDNDAVNQKAIRWQVTSVLVTNPADWPSADGTSGITFVADMRTAGKVGDALETPTNFFLFFRSRSLHAHFSDGDGDGDD